MQGNHARQTIRAEEVRLSRPCLAAPQPWPQLVAETPSSAAFGRWPQANGCGPPRGPCVRSSKGQARRACADSRASSGLSGSAARTACQDTRMRQVMANKTSCACRGLQPPACFQTTALRLGARPQLAQGHMDAMCHNHREACAPAARPGRARRPHGSPHTRPPHPSSRPQLRGRSAP